LAALLAVVAAAALANVPASGGLACGRTPGSFLDGACAIADFDGDHEPDIAFGSDFTSRRNHRATLTIRLSATARAQTLSFDNRHGARRVTLRDVDGNGTLDVVLTTGLSTRVAVFLNDGAGDFRPDAEGRYLRDAGDDDRHVEGPSSGRRFTCDGLAKRSWQAAQVPAFHSHSTPESRKAAPLAPAIPGLARSSGPIRIRAP
jgi:hypothetical protein